MEELMHRMAPGGARIEVPHPAQEGRACPLCRGDHFELMHHWEPGHPRNPSPRTLSFWQCRCGMALLHPLPAPHELPGAGDWWSDGRACSHPVRRIRYKQLRMAVQNFLFGSPLKRFVRQTARVVPSGRLLDVGCGNGELLQVASSRFQCEGLEPSAVAARVAASQGFHVINSSIEQAPLPSQAYDVVTMNAVLEHVSDPVQVLRGLHHALRADGVVAIKVPKLHGPSHRWYGREWNGFRVGYHLTMFTGETLRLCLAAAGFVPLRHPCRDRRLDDILVVWGRKAPSLVSTRAA